MSKEPKTITEFLRERGQKPRDFVQIIKARADRAEYSYDNWGTNYTQYIRDIKRFGELEVMLEGKVYFGGYPGVRKETITTVYEKNGSVHEHEEAYIDGGYQTWHLDNQERDFGEIVNAQKTKRGIVVTLRTTFKKNNPSYGEEESESKIIL